MSKLIKPQKSILITIYGSKYKAKLYCFGDIASVFSDSDEAGEEYGDDYPEIVLKTPKVISRVERGSIIFYLNQAAFARTEGALFSYNKEIYNYLCLGSWEGYFYKYRNNRIFPNLLFEYLSTYNNSGHSCVEDIENGKCVLCGGYKSYGSDSQDICDSCAYKIRSPDGDSVYWNDISKFDPKLIKFNNKIKSTFGNG